MVNTNEIKSNIAVTLAEAASSKSAYIHMLDTISKFHKYPLPQQATLSRAPEHFTAVAEERIWNNIFHVNIKQSAEGLSLADDSSPQGFKIVYDISEIEPAPPANILWHFNTEHDGGVFQGITSENASILEGLLQTCWQIEDFYRDSNKSGDDLLLLSASIAYILMQRLSFVQEAELLAQQTIMEYNIREADVSLQEISDISREILNGIQSYVQKAEKHNEKFPLKSAMEHVQKYITDNIKGVLEDDKQALKIAAPPSLSITPSDAIATDANDLPETHDTLTFEPLFIESASDTIKENVFAQSVIQSQNVIEKTKEERATKNSKINDFGEKIGGAKKDIYSMYKDMITLATKIDIEQAPLSETWPKPNYEKLLKGGMESWRVSAIRAMRDIIAKKPSPGRGGRYKLLFLNAWAKKVTFLREIAIQVLDPNSRIRNFDDLQMKLRGTSTLVHSDFEKLKIQVLLYDILGHQEDCSRMKLAFKQFYRDSEPHENPEDAIHKNKYVLFFQQDFLSSGNTMEEAIKNYAKKKERGEITKGKEKSKNLSRLYGVYIDHSTFPRSFFIGRKIGRNVIPVKQPFSNAREAQEYKKSHLEELDERFALMKKLPSERGEYNKPRNGIAHRNGDISPDDFMKAFGFRGVEFGNYVDDELRQQNLNDAYDAFMDLAKITGLPSRALSLGGKLGLAFGARGAGRAFAHYEPQKNVINLTKKNGAGSLGHEWFHALDNMLARENENKKDAFLSDLTEDYIEIAHQELSTAVHELRDFIRTGTGLITRSKKLDSFRYKPYWSTAPEYMARSFEMYIKTKMAQEGMQNDYLVNILNEDTWRTQTADSYPYPYPTIEEAKETEKYFDNLFANIAQRSEGENIILYSASADIDAQNLEKERIPYDEMTVEELALHVFGEQVLGIETAFYDGDHRLHGHFDQATATIYLNRSSECDLSWVFAHEVFHVMKEADPNLYIKLMEVAGGMDSFSKVKMDEYRAERQKPEMSDDLVRQEMLADAFADYTTGRRTIVEMIEKDVNTVRCALNFLSRAMENLKSCFWGARKEKIKEKYPSARLSEEQFSDLSHGLEYIQQELAKEHNLSKGQEILLSMLAEAPKLDRIHSPYTYMPKKQFEFDCEAVYAMREFFLERDVRETIATYSSNASMNYAERLMPVHHNMSAAR